MTVAPGPFDAKRRHRPLSPRQRRWTVWGYLLLGLANAALALPSANDRLIHAIIGALFTVLAVAVWLKKWPPSVDGPADAVAHPRAD